MALKHFRLSIAHPHAIDEHSVVKRSREDSFCCIVEGNSQDLVLVLKGVHTTANAQVPEFGRTIISTTHKVGHATATALHAVHNFCMPIQFLEA